MEEEDENEEQTRKVKGCMYARSSEEKNFYRNKLLQKWTLLAVLQINACNTPKKIDNSCEENRR